MQIQLNVPLAQFTSFGVGGQAAKLITLTGSKEIKEAAVEAGNDKIWLLGHGTNVLISDHGLSGTTLRFSGGAITVEGNVLIADAGVAWDELVQTAINRKLWGLELTSGIPGSVGAAAFINIAAYGQSQSDTVEWVEVFERSADQIKKLTVEELRWDYKQSIIQYNDNYIITRVAHKLSLTPSTQLTYQSALDIAVELGMDPDTLAHRREIILETRKRAGSLFAYRDQYARTVGSFFRNPLVAPEQAELVEKFDESGRTKAQLDSMNRVHGGSSLRVSAAHVMLAAGFKRGQKWGPVRLHPDHVLKLENTGEATAQQIYDVAQTIMQTVRDKLNIELEPEARILGPFDH